MECLYPVFLSWHICFPSHILLMKMIINIKREGEQYTKNKDRCIAYSDAVYYGGKWICHWFFQGIVVDNYRA